MTMIQNEIEPADSSNKRDLPSQKMLVLILCVTFPIQSYSFINEFTEYKIFQYFDVLLHLNDLI
jgi:hypothetical protein